MKPSLIFSIWVYSAFERLEVCQKIAMRQNNTPRLGRCPRSKQDLRDVISRDGLVCETFAKSVIWLRGRRRRRLDGRRSGGVWQILQYKPWDGGIERRLFARRKNQFNARVP